MSEAGAHVYAGGTREARTRAEIAAQAAERRALREGRVRKEPFAEWYWRKREWAHKVAGFVIDRKQTTEFSGSSAAEKKWSEHGQFDRKRWRFYIGVTEKEMEYLDRALKDSSEIRYLDIGLVDRILTCLGENNVLNELYPVEEEEGQEG